jgi:hypothetical protein
MKKIMLSFLFMFSSTIAFAHGEDKLGPNGGFIRMPGAFHTEIIPDSKNKLKVYLLDMQWENPSVVKSNLKVIHNGKTEAACTIKDTFYVCIFPKSVNLKKKGKLKLIAEREEQKGMEVSYPLPLKLQTPDDGQGRHH